jgi:hypothetical protein
MKRELTIDEAHAALEAGKTVVDRDKETWSLVGKPHYVLKYSESLSATLGPFYLYKDEPAPAPVPRWQSETCEGCGYVYGDKYCRKYQAACVQENGGWEKACPDWQGR